jgi:hypothetical protein
MANPEQVRVVRGKGWNRWRQRHPDIIVDLSGADLSGADLSGANLNEADLNLANLIGADLSEAISVITSADLRNLEFLG